MAETLTDLIRESEGREFQPYAYYGHEEDSLRLHFKPDADYAVRLNSRVTVYRSMNDDSLVGCSVKSVHRVLDEIKWFDVELKDDSMRLKMLFVAQLGSLEKDEQKRVINEIASYLSTWDLDIPELETT